MKLDEKILQRLKKIKWIRQNYCYIAMLSRATSITAQLVHSHSNKFLKLYNQ